MIRATLGSSATEIAQLLGTPRRCRVPRGVRPSVGARLQRKYIYAFAAPSTSGRPCARDWFANTVFPDLDAVGDALEAGLVALESDPHRVPRMTGFNWIVSV